MCACERERERESELHLSEVDRLEDGRQVSGVIHSGHQDVVALILARLCESRHTENRFTRLPL